MHNKKTTEVPTETLQITRLLQSPKEEVFKAWTTPKELLSWWEDLTAAEFNPQAGGDFRLVWKKQDSKKDDITIGEMREAYSPDRLVYTWRPGTGPESLVTVDFIGKLKGTQLILIHEFLRPPQILAAYRQGWNQALDSLEDFLSRANKL